MPFKIVDRTVQDVPPTEQAAKLDNVVVIFLPYRGIWRRQFGGSDAEMHEASAA